MLFSLSQCIRSKDSEELYWKLDEIVKFCGAKLAEAESETSNAPVDRLLWRFKDPRRLKFHQILKYTNTSIIPYQEFLLNSAKCLDHKQMEF